MTKNSSFNPRVALVYDRVNTAFGGAERVLLALHQAFPDAPLYTAIANSKATRWASVFEIRTSWLQFFPFASHMHRMLAAFMPLAFEALDLSTFDIVISVTSAEAKGVKTLPNQLHLCYLLSPPRYLYHQRHELVQAAWWSHIPGLAQLGNTALSYLTWWDQIAMKRPDVVLTLSHTVAARYQQIYKRAVDAVIYPPSIQPATSAQLKAVTIRSFVKNHPQFLLMVSRLVPYKRVDLAILAAEKTSMPLIVIGDGPDAAKLKKIANQDTLLLPQVMESELMWLYQHCQMLLVPGVEDFGLTALEANASGKPAIVNKNAGVAEVIQDGVHGVHVFETTVTSLSNAIKRCQLTSFDPTALRQNAQKYDTSIFVSEFKTMVEKAWQRHRSSIIRR